LAKSKNKTSPQRRGGRKEEISGLKLKTRNLTTEHTENAKKNLLGEKLKTKLSPQGRKEIQQLSYREHGEKAFIGTGWSEITGRLNHDPGEGIQRVFSTACRSFLSSSNNPSRKIGLLTSMRTLLLFPDGFTQFREVGF